MAGMYRVFGCGPYAEDDIIMAAMVRAGSDGADVISMSFGGGWADETTNPYEIITSNLVARGVAL